MRTNKRILWMVLFGLVVFGFVLRSWPTRTHAASLDTPLGIHVYLRQQGSFSPKVEVKSVQATSQSVEATLCIEMPTLEPWNPYATLMVNGISIPNSEVRLLNAKDPSIMKSAQRCYAFVFPFSIEDTPSAKGILKLETLWLELGNGQLNNQVISEVRRRLESVAPGLDFEAVYVPGKNGGGMDIRLLSLPNGMSEDDAIALIQKLSIDELPVDWQTEISFK